MYSAANLINVFEILPPDSLQPLFDSFRARYPLGPRGMYVFDIFLFLRTRLPSPAYEHVFFSNLFGLSPSMGCYNAYQQGLSSGAIVEITSELPDVESLLERLLSEDRYCVIVVVQCSRGMRCRKCGQRVGFKVEPEKTHSLVLIGLSKKRRSSTRRRKMMDPTTSEIVVVETQVILEETIVCYLDSEVLGNRSTCNFCEIRLKTLAESLVEVKEFVAVRKGDGVAGNRNVQS